MDLLKSTHSLAETSGTKASRTCQEALGHQSLQLKEWRKWSIWKWRNLQLSRVGKENLLLWAYGTSVLRSWNRALKSWHNILISKKRCSRPFLTDYHQLQEYHLRHHLEDSIERLHNLAENVKLSTHGKHPTTYLMSAKCCTFEPPNLCLLSS